MTDINNKTDQVKETNGACQGSCSKKQMRQYV